MQPKMARKAASPALQVDYYFALRGFFLLVAQFSQVLIPEPGRKVAVYAQLASSATTMALLCVRTGDSLLEDRSLFSTNSVFHYP